MKKNSNKFINIKYKFFINYRKNNEYWLPKYKYRKIVLKYLQKSHWSVFNVLNILKKHYGVKILEKNIIKYNLLFIYKYLQFLKKIPENKEDNKRIDELEKIHLNDKFIVANHLKNDYIKQLNEIICYINKDICSQLNNNDKEISELLYYLLWFTFLYTDYCLSKIGFDNLFFNENYISTSFRKLNYCVNKYTRILQDMSPKKFNYIIQNINYVFYYNV